MGNACTQAELLLHLGPTQVNVAVAQAYFLVNILVIQLKRRCLGRIKHLSSSPSTSTWPVGISGLTVPSGRCLTRPCHLQDELIAHPLGGRKYRSPVRVEHHLHQSLVITQVNKNDTTMITPAMHPATESHLLIKMGFV